MNDRKASMFNDNQAVSRRSFIRAAGAVGTASAIAPLAYAQNLAPAYPNKPIKFIVGFAPGGLADALPRLVAPAMSERLGQQIIIENRTGAAGNLATTFVAKAPPDGYNILATSVGQIVVSPHTSSLGVNPLTDLRHISMIGEGDQILNINAAVPAQTLAEFVALVKKSPGTMFYGDAGAGGSLHLYMEYFKLLAGIDMQPVHYRGTAHLLPDFLSNRVQMSLNGYPAIEGYISQGKLRPLMLVGKQRDPRMPGVPTAAEAGYKPMEACSNWFGLHAPKGTPDAIVDRLNEALVYALNTETVKAGLATNAIRAVGDTPQAFTARIAADYEVFGKVARSAKIQAE
jgi:tripartite-type tricarboxylate transporter receptor subunit TctC